jgi:hypothetical protein
MAHFAELDADNTVMRVIVVANAECVGPDGQESEALGRQFCERLFGGRWVQTSYSGKIRRRYAAPGGKYDARLDAFIARRPFPSWTLNETTGEWEPPRPRPSGLRVRWDETAREWIPLPQTTTQRDIKS